MNCVDEIIKVIGKDKVLTGHELSSRYSHIWRMSESLVAKAVLLPENTQEVSTSMKICNLHSQSVVVHGGLTNLVGGTRTNINDIVISLEKMNEIIEVDTFSRTVTVEAGVILESLHQELKKVDLLFPLTFGAKGSAQIGGIISSNAGGLRVVRYGMTRNLVLGLEAVLADGTIVSSLKKIIKDNSAYDLKQLFIGSEGTLGIITKAVLKLEEEPTSRCSAFAATNDYAKVVAFLKHVDRGLAGLMSGFELIWKNTYTCMTAPDHVKQPLPTGYEYYILIESLGADQISDQESLEKLLEVAIEKGLVIDAVLAQTQSDLDWFWKIREDVHVIKSSCTYDQHFDISLPIESIGEYVMSTLFILRKLSFVNTVYTFGHIADGNIHFIVDRTSIIKSHINQINEIIYKPLEDLGGSVSAEHGIGVDKKAYLKYSRSEVEINLMKLLKKTLDPNDILNMGKIF